MDTWKFLDRWFYPAEGWLELSFLMPKDRRPPRNQSPIVAWWFHLPDDFDMLQAVMPLGVQDRNNAGYGVHFSLCLHKEPPKAETGKELQARGNDASVHVVPGLWADIDHMDDEGKSDKAFSLMLCGHPPTMLVNSGGGLHAYWKFEQPYEINTPKDRRYIRDLVRGVALILKGDTNVCNPSRLFRLPGTVNTKPERNGALCELICCSDQLYSPADFEPYIEKRPERPQIILPPLPAELRGRLPRSVDEYLATGAPQGERNHRLFVVSRHYNDNGMGVGEAERDLMPRAMADGLDEREALRTIDSAFRYTPGTPNIPTRITHALAAGKALGG